VLAALADSVFGRELGKEEDRKRRRDCKARSWL